LFKLQFSTVVRQDGSCPVRYGLLASPEERISDVKVRLSELTGYVAEKVPPENILLAEIRQYKICTMFTDNQRVRGTFSGRPIYAYQLCPLDDLSKGTNARSETDPQIQRLMTSAKNQQSGVNNINNNNNSISNSTLRLPNDGNSLSVGGNHSRQSSYSSCSSMAPYESSLPHDNFIVVLHRKMIRQDTYFLAPQKSKPDLFGLPLVIPWSENMSHLDLYKRVWTLVARLVTPLPPSEGPNIYNHAQDWYAYHF